LGGSGSARLAHRVCAMHDGRFGLLLMYLLRASWIASLLLQSVVVSKSDCVSLGVRMFMASCPGVRFGAAAS